MSPKNFLSGTPARNGEGFTRPQLISIEDAARSQLLRIGGKSPHYSAVYRWARKGVVGKSGKRVKLDHVRIGRRLAVTEAGIEKFLTDLAREDAVYFDRPTAQPVPANRPASPTLRKRQIEAAEAACAKRGI